MNGLSTVRPPSQSTPLQTPGGEAKDFNMLSALQTSLDSQGLSYVEANSQPSHSLRLYTTYDAVVWMMQFQNSKFTAIETCMEYLNELLDSGKIWAPGSQSKRFNKLLFGVYYITFSPPTTVPSSCAVRSDYLIEVSFQDNALLPPDASVMLSVEAAGKVGRQELAVIVFNTIFTPGIAFRIRLEWLFSSGSFLCEVVDSWHHRARSFGMHLLSVPSNAFDLTDFDPLRMKIEIPFKPEEICADFKSPEEVFLALTRYFAFMAFNEEGLGQYFMHITGVAFIRHKPKSIEWVWNFQVSRRWQTVLENDESDRLLEMFREHVANVDNRLVDLMAGQ